MDTKEIISTVLNREKISASAFAKSIGITPTQIYDLQSGKIKNISANVGNKIVAKYPNYNLAWLISGNGDMLINESSYGNAVMLGKAQRIDSDEAIAVKYYEISPTASFVSFCNEMSEDADSVKIIPEHNEVLDDSYCVFKVTGESMAPQIQDQARVLCREVNPTRWHQLRDCIVAIAYDDKFVIKRIQKNKLESSNYLVLASDNPEYPDTEKVSVSSIRCVFKAVRIISQRIF